MTNIEAYAGYRERQRVQTNQPDGAFARQDMGLFVRPRIPDPGLGGCEAYEASDLSIDNGLAQDFQHILDEDPNLDPRIVELHKLTHERKLLNATYRKLLSVEYNRLIAKCRVRKTYWHAGPVKRRWRKPWYEKLWVGWRWVMKKQYLKPRVIAYRALVSFDLETGVKTYEVRRKTIRPHRWVEVRKPKFVWKLKRPGGLVPYKPRVSEIRIVTDWSEVRRKFAAFKLNQLDLRLKALNLRQRCIQLRRTLIRSPKLAASWTTSGYVPPPTITVPVALPYAGSEYSLGYLHGLGIGRVRWPGYLEEGKYHPTVDLLCPEATGWGNTPDQAMAMARERSYIPHLGYRTVGVESDRCRLRLGQRVGVDLEPESDAKLSAATADPQRILRSYATLVSLTKASDYTFHLVRSIGELKDARDTFKQARDFLRWLRRPIVRGLTPKKVYAGIAGAYLAWKFAIEPTIQDVNTVIDNTVEYLTDIRRSLRALVDGLAGGSSIYHARSAYASGNGLVSGRVRLHADNTSFGSLQYTLSWARRYQHQLPILARSSTTPDSAVICRSLDPTLRGAGMVWSSPGEEWASFTATIAEEADDGQIWRRQFAGSHGWIHDGDPFGGSEAPPEDALNHCHRVQQLHALPVPYDIRDVAAGVLFASYHAGDILRLATNGRLDLGTITDYMNQIVIVESWLKNPEAQRAVGKELLRHTDIPFVAWQLTPLSFIYDWFTTSGTIVEALNSLSRETFEVIPQALFGVWQSERHELLSCVPNLVLRERTCQELVREWTVVEVSRRSSESHFYAAPTRSTIFDDCIWEPSPGTAVFSRTGLYRFRRGEFEPPGLDQLDVYMPKLRLDIDTGKLVTLSAMIGGFL